MTVASLQRRGRCSSNPSAGSRDHTAGHGAGSRCHQNVSETLASGGRACHSSGFLCLSQEMPIAFNSWCRRTQRALGLGPLCHHVQLGETLYCSGPSSPNGKMMVGETISRSPKLEDSPVVESLTLPVLERGNFNQRADQALVPWRLSWGVRSGEAPFALEADSKGWPGPGGISSWSRSGPRQCPRGSSSTGIPGQRASPTASLV